MLIWNFAEHKGRIRKTLVKQDKKQVKPRKKRQARKLLISMKEYTDKEKDTDKFKEMKDLRAISNFVDEAEMSEWVRLWS